MANDYNNDDLEGFFRRRLKDYEENPAPALWEKIGTMIPSKPAVAWWKKPVWWLGSILVALFLFSLWQYQHIRQFEKVIDEQRADIEALKNDRIASAKPEQSRSFDEAASTDFSGHLLHESEKITSTETRKTPRGATFGPTDKKVMQAGIAKKPELMITAIANEQPIPPTNIGIKAPSGKADFLKNKSFATLKTPTTPIPGPIKIDTEKGKAGFYFSINGGTLITNYNSPLNKSKKEVKQSDVPGFHLSNTVRDELTVLAGIQFNKNWSFETGVGYRNNRLSLFDSQQFNYSGEQTIAHDNFGNPIGAYTNNSDQSPVVRYQIINNLQSPGTDIEEGDPFNLDAFINYHNRYLSLPLWLKYRTGNKRLHLYGKTGIAWNILTVSNKRLNASNLSDDRLTIEKVQIKNDALNDAFLELGFAAGVEYDLGLRSTLGLEALYYHSVASVLTTKQDAIGLSFSMRYNF